MTLIPRTKRKAYTFNLDDATERGDYSDLISSPNVRVLSSKFEKITHKTFDAEGGGTEDQELHIYVEVEECVL